MQKNASKNFKEHAELVLRQFLHMVFHAYNIRYSTVKIREKNSSTVPAIKNRGTCIMRYKYISILLAGLVCLHALYAKKPDSAFGPEVWEREKELLQSIEGKDHADDAGMASTYMKLARIFKDNSRELTYLDLAERSASKLKDGKALSEIMMLRLEHYATYAKMQPFRDYADRVSRYMASAKDRRLSNVEYLVIKRHADEGMTQTALATARNMLSAATRTNDTYRQAYAYYSIGLIYLAVNRHGEAVEALEKSVRMMEGSMKDFPTLDVIKAQLELLCSQCCIGRHPESLMTCRTAVKLLDKFIASEDPDLQMGINCMSMRLYIECYAARNHMAMNELDSARLHLENAAACLYPSIGLDGETYNETSAMYYNRTGDYEQALRYADLSVDAFKASKLAPYHINALTLKKEILANMGKWQEAFENQAIIEHAKDSLDASRFARELSELQTIYEVNKLSAQKQRQQVVLFFTVLCCLLLLTIAIIYIVYYHRLRMKNQSLYEQINSNLHNIGSSVKMLQMAPEEELSREMQLFRKIAQLMDEEQPYRNSSFNRTTLAKLIGTNEKYIADAVREGARTTVSNYITDIRLNHSLELLSDETEDGNPISLDVIARNSGFGSYSSFWRAFQKKYSITPSEYRSFHLKNAQSI